MDIGEVFPEAVRKQQKTEKKASKKTTKKAQKAAPAPADAPAPAEAPAPAQDAPQSAPAQETASAPESGWDELQATAKELWGKEWQTQMGKLASDIGLSAQSLSEKDVHVLLDAVIERLSMTT